MIKKLPTFLIPFLIFAPLVTQAQEPAYFQDRLLIKYESSEKISRLKTKLGTDPHQTVEQFLIKNGARQTQPMFSGPMRAQLKQKNVNESEELLRINEVIFNRKIDPKILAGKISRMPGVAYAEPRYLRKIFYQPNDSLLESYVTDHNFPQAWDITQGSSDIVIAIVDAGVGYTHPELDDKLWINQGEVPTALRVQVDQNADGTVTSTEIKQYLQQTNGDYNNDNTILLDDALHTDSPFMDNMDGDGNEFVDDLFGWDFWESGGLDGNPVVKDNNPIHSGSDHGTHVAGIAAAETDNGEGIASAGFNSNYMAVKVGGIRDLPETSDDESLLIGFPFEGITYAANNGADVINCSWGGGNFSQAELDIINYANAMGTVVVAASGNGGIDGILYPAAYENALAVGWLDNGNSISSLSNYGYKLDVLASGSGISSTSFNNTYATYSGTSMSTPVVSGLAALLKDIHPDWTSQRIGLHIRGTATSIEGANSSNYLNKLGHGSIDAEEALNSDKPGIKMVSQRFENQDGRKLGLEQQGTVYIEVVNFGNTASLDFHLQSFNNGIELNSSSQQLGSLATGDTAEIAFDLTINNSFSVTDIPAFKLFYSDGSQDYRDFGIFRYENFLYDELDINNVLTSLAADGSVGFVNPLEASGGVGFIPRSSPSEALGVSNNVLYEGGLMLEFNNFMRSAVRSVDGQLDRDFVPKQVFTTEKNGLSDLDGHASFTAGTDTVRQVVVDLETFSYNTPELSNVVYLKYTIRNPANFNIVRDMYVGLFNDWDIGNWFLNSVSFSAADSVLYLSDASDDSQPKIAVAHLSPISSALAINNPVQGHSDSVTFGIYDGFTDQEKKDAVRAGTAKTNITGSDVSAVIASGPYTLEPKAEITVGFVYAFGNSVDELRSQISAARSQVPFEVSPLGRAHPTEVPMQTKLHQNYPNPFNPTTQFRIDIEQTAHVNLTIYDVLGRKVHVLVDEELEARSHFIQFNAQNLSSGVYFARLKTGERVQTIPLTLIK